MNSMRVHAASASNSTDAAKLGAMPEWNLADLYPSMDPPRVQAHLADRGSRST